MPRDPALIGSVQQKSNPYRSATHSWPRESCCSSCLPRSLAAHQRPFLSADAPVGIDVEPIRTLPGMTEVVAEFFPLAARAAFASAPPEEQEIVFFRWWTRIEAAVKVSGRGLDAALSCFNDVTCQSFEAVPGLAVAVAAEGEGPLIVDWQVDRNLSWLEPEQRRLYVASSRLVCQKTG